MRQALQGAQVGRDGQVHLLAGAGGGKRGGGGRERRTGGGGNGVIEGRPAAAAAYTRPITQWHGGRYPKPARHIDLPHRFTPLQVLDLVTRHSASPSLSPRQCPQTLPPQLLHLQRNLTPNWVRLHVTTTSSPTSPLLPCPQPRPRLPPTLPPPPAIPPPPHLDAERGVGATQAHVAGRDQVHTAAYAAACRDRGRAGGRAGGRMAGLGRARQRVRVT